MNLNQLITTFLASGNAQKKSEMELYLRNQFPFIGIQKPIRSELQKPFIQSLKSEKKIDWDLVSLFWQREEREFQYVALDYLISKKKFLQPEDVSVLKELIITKSWWETVDTITSHLIGFLFLNFPETRNEINSWRTSKNMWLRRTSIIAQLKSKEKTEIEFLEKAILANLGSDEFFINKAIGWALREYSKTNPKWVRHFLTKNKLQPLSVKEASKYL